MKKLGFIVAVVLLLSILAASIAAAATQPGALEASAAQSAAVAAGKAVMMTDSPSTFGQHGFCDQDDYASPASY